LVSDGDGGAIIAWTVYCNSSIDIYAQRIDAAGAALWAAGGVLLSDQPYDKWLNGIVSDSAGGAIVVWADNVPPRPVIRAQRVNAAGTRLWTTAGILVSGDALGGYDLASESPIALSDGAGGAIVVWRGYYLRDYGSYYQDETDGYAQRINASGVKQWGFPGS
jgi:hypothetical protein